MLTHAVPPTSTHFFQQVYVQDLIQANGAKLWPLFEAGARVYVCGDARRMVRHAVTVVSWVCLLCFHTATVCATNAFQYQQPVIPHCLTRSCVVLLTLCCCGCRSVACFPTTLSLSQAPDVRAAFKDVARTFGGRSDAAAESWMGGLLESNRYLEDVWAG